MKKVTAVLGLMLISSTAFSMTQIGRERSALAAKNSALAVAKASRNSMGTSLKGVGVFVVSAEEIKRSLDTSTVKVEIGFDSGHGMKYSENYIVEATEVGFVKSVRFQEQ